MAVFGWRERIIRSFPTALAARAHGFATGSYTQTHSPSPPSLCALRFQWAIRKPRLAQLLSSAAPSPWLLLFQSTCLICGLELIALVAFLEEPAASLVGFPIWFYMDSSNSLAAITRGGSNTAAIAVPAARVWELARRFHIRAWFARVPSDLNPAALPSRDRHLPFSAGPNGKFRSLTQMVRMCRDALRAKIRPPRKRGLKLSLRNPHY